MDLITTIDEYGNKFWKLPNGKLHREDGPAIERNDKTLCWFKNGHLHRTDGPAVITYNLIGYWWLEGIEYSEETYKIKIRKMKLQKIFS